MAIHKLIASPDLFIQEALRVGCIEALFDWMHWAVVLDVTPTPPPLSLLEVTVCLMRRLVQSGGDYARTALGAIPEAHAKLSHVLQRYRRYASSSYWSAEKLRLLQSLGDELHSMFGAIGLTQYLWSREAHPMFPQHFKHKCVLLLLVARLIPVPMQLIELLCNELATRSSCERLELQDADVSLLPRASPPKQARYALLQGIVSVMPTTWLCLRKLSGKNATSSHQMQTARFKKIWADCVEELNRSNDVEAKAARKHLLSILEL